jgi:hypothetical protein
MTKGINLKPFLLLMLFVGSKGSKACSSTMDITGLCVPVRNLRYFPMLHVSSSLQTGPSARRANAANSDCSDFHIFRRQTITLGFDITLSLISQGVLMNYSSIFVFVSFVFISYVSRILYLLVFYVPPFPLVAICLFTQHVNKKNKII